MSVFYPLKHDAGLTNWNGITHPNMPVGSTIAECELSVLRRQSLRRRVADIETVQQKLAAWEMQRNQRQTGIDWRFTTDDARFKLKRLYPIVNVQNLT